MAAWMYFLTACTFPPPECADGYDRNDNDVCVLAPNAPSDTGLDALAGAYQGEITISIDADAGELVIQDVCAGTVAFDVAESALDGLVRCSFEDTVAALIGTDPFEGNMTGSIAGDGSTDGNIFLDLATFGVLDESWAGSVSPEEIRGSFVGAMTFSVGALEVPVQFDGAFVATP